MKDQTFEEFATVWIYLLSRTENELACIFGESDFAYEFRWRPTEGSASPDLLLNQQGGECDGRIQDT